MELVQELKRIGEEKGFYSIAFFNEVDVIVQVDRKRFVESIIYFLEHIAPSNFDAKECQMVLTIVLSNFKDVENDTEQIGKALGQFVLQLLKIEYTADVMSKDHLLYLVMDILDVAMCIEGCNESTQQILFDAVKGTINVVYDYERSGASDAYLKNYKILQFYDEFSKETHRKELRELLLHHPDERVREDALEESI